MSWQSAAAFIGTSIQTLINHIKFISLIKQVLIGNALSVCIIRLATDLPREINVAAYVTSTFFQLHQKIEFFYNCDLNNQSDVYNMWHLTSWVTILYNPASLLENHNTLLLLHQCFNDICSIVSQRQKAKSLPYQILLKCYAKLSFAFYSLWQRQ